MIDKYAIVMVDIQYWGSVLGNWHASFLHSGTSGPYNQGLSVSHDSVFTPDTTNDHHHHNHHGHHNPPPALAIATRGVNMVSHKGRRSP